MQEIPLLTSTAQVDIDRHLMEIKTKTKTPMSRNQEGNMLEVRKQ